MTIPFSLGTHASSIRVIPVALSLLLVILLDFSEGIAVASVRMMTLNVFLPTAPYLNHTGSRGFKCDFGLKNSGCARSTGSNTGQWATKDL